MFSQVEINVALKDCPWAAVRKTHPGTRDARIWWGGEREAAGMKG